MASIRSFVAILLDPAVQAALGEAIEILRPATRGVTWVSPDNLHITLKFLGQVDDASVPGLVEALNGAVQGVARFDATIRGLGAFPTITRPRVIWAGVGAGADVMAALAARVERALVALGVPSEDRPFSAHVTLGRVREPRRDVALADALITAQQREFGAVSVDHLSLMRSELSPGGSRYAELASCRLEPRRRG